MYKMLSENVLPVVVFVIAILLSLAAHGFGSG
jgi:hypothetical protein